MSRSARDEMEFINLEQDFLSMKTRAEKAERELQDARNLWNFSPEDDHQHWIQVMNESFSFKAERDALKSLCEKLIPYTHHKEDCACRKYNLPCTCGLDELLKQGRGKCERLYEKTTKCRTEVGKTIQG